MKNKKSIAKKCTCGHIPLIIENGKYTRVEAQGVTSRTQKQPFEFRVECVRCEKVGRTSGSKSAAIAFWNNINKQEKT